MKNNPALSISIKPCLLTPLWDVHPLTVADYVKHPFSWHVRAYLFKFL